jgi:hypothetical protein
MPTIRRAADRPPCHRIARNAFYDPMLSRCSLERKETMRRHAVAILAVAGAMAVAIGQAAAAPQDYCDGVARDYANRYGANSTLGGAAVGGMMGAVGGAVLGGIINGNRGAGTGAAIGGAGGAILGAGQGSHRWNELYNQAFDDCMRNGPRGAPAFAAPAPEPWTREWYEYCSANHRSFNPDTGYFMAKGKRVFCR